MANPQTIGLDRGILGQIAGITYQTISGNALNTVNASASDSLAWTLYDGSGVAQASGAGTFITAIAGFAFNVAASVPLGAFAAGSTGRFKAVFTSADDNTVIEWNQEVYFAQAWPTAP